MEEKDVKILELKTLLLANGWLKYAFYIVSEFLTDRFFIVFIRSSPDIRWKCYKNTANNRTKKENIEICENRMLSVIKVSIEQTKKKGSN